MVFPLRKAASPFLLKMQLSLSHFAVKAKRCSNVEHKYIKECPNAHFFLAYYCHLEQLFDILPGFLTASTL